MRHDFSKILTLYYIAINLEISDFEMSDKFLDPSIASHEVLLYLFLTKLFILKFYNNHPVSSNWSNCAKNDMKK